MTKPARGSKSDRVEYTRFFTEAGAGLFPDPFAGIAWTKRTAVIKGSSGEIKFKQEGIEAPSSWSQSALDIVASKYFRGKIGTPQRETSVKAMILRVAKTIADFGFTLGYLTENSRDALRDELTYLIVNQMMSFNSPVWFNVGIDPKPQCSACFLNSVDDTMESILDLAKTEGMLFRGGSGTGTNFSSLRSSKEWLSGGGQASGPVSFMKGFDAFAGAIKSGGKCLAGWQNIYTEVGPQTAKALAESGKDFICLSFDPQAGRYKAKTARAWLDGPKRIVRVVTDKGEFFPSDDHPFRLSDGSMRHAGDLRAGNSLFQCSVDERSGYLRVGLHDGKKGKDLFHRMVARDVMGMSIDGMSVHHIDENKLNNSPLNIRVMPQGDHAAIHAQVSVDAGEHVFQQNSFSHAGKDNGMCRDSAFWSDLERSEEYRKKQGEILQKSGRAAEMQELAARQKMLNTAFRVLNAGKSIGSFKEYVAGRRAAIGAIPSVPALANKIERIFGSYDVFVSEVAANNHRVLSVEEVGIFDSYHVEVDCPSPDDKGPGSGHNFVIWSGDSATGSGVAVFNTRRAAKIAILNADHPDIVDFIECKVREEKKAWALIDAGFDGSFNGEAYQTVSYQNANNSVRVTDAFMEAVGSGKDWDTIAVKGGGRVDTYKAADLWKKIAEAAHVCGCPGVQFDTTTNKWNTCLDTARINSSNPCSEFVFLDDSACNLASLNLRKFQNNQGDLIAPSFKKAIETTILAQEILVGAARYPTEKIGANSVAYRPIGLGYANLGAFLMTRGLPYDSDEGRAYAAAVTALMTGHAYAVSARIAAARGPFPAYKKNKKSFLRVVSAHEAECERLGSTHAGMIPDDLMDAAVLAWEEAVVLVEKHGARNAQLTLLAPTGTIGFMMDCFVGDTVVAVADGRNAVSFRQLAEEGKDIEVYASENGRTVVRTMHNPRLIKELDAVVRVTLDDGSTVRCTREHLFLLKDGNYVEAQNLTPGTSLMRFDSVVTEKSGKLRREIWMGPEAGGNRNKGKQWKYQYRLTGARLFAGYDGRSGGLVHHMNEDSLDDSPMNLKFCVNVGEHQREHWKAKSPEERSQIWCERQASRSVEERRESARKSHAAQTPEQRKAIGIKASQTHTSEERALWTTRGWASIGAEERSRRLKKGWETRRQNNQNHKVVSVVPDGFEDVYCGEVEGTRNFSIITSLDEENPKTSAMSGIVVHNCDTTGIEPDIALVKYKKLVGGGSMKIVNQSVPAALANLGYKSQGVEQILAWLSAHDTIEGCPIVRDADLAVFDCAFEPANGKRSIHYMGHVKMMAAVQPFLSGAISKCVTGDTIVPTELGLIRIGSLYDGKIAEGEFRELGIRVASRHKEEVADQFYFNGVRPVVRVTLGDRRRLGGTGAHRVLVACDDRLDWKELCELEQGDWVAVSLGSNMWGKDKEINFSPSPAYGSQHKDLFFPTAMTPELGMFLGMLTSDGHLTRCNYSIGLTKNCQEVRDRFVYLAQRLFNANAIERKDLRNGVMSVQFASKAVMEFLDSLGFTKKQIPDVVLTSSKETVLAYLSGMYLDGWVSQSVSISQKHATLISDIQQVWTNLGVHTYVTDNEVDGNNYPVLHASAGFREKAALFLEWIEPHKKDRAARLGNGESRVVLPLPGLRARVQEAAKLANVTQKYRNVFDKRTQNLRIETLLGAASELGVGFDSELSGYVYVPVEAVEVGPPERVFDLSVPGSTSYVANGIMSHNTVNMPKTTTVEEIMDVYMTSWKLGLKSVAIYRDGCKRTQPVTVKDESKHVVANTPVVFEHRRRLPIDRDSITHKFSISGHEGYLTCGKYEDGTMGEMFIRMAKEGSTVGGLMDCFATVVSVAIQHGVPLSLLCDKMTRTKFDPNGWTENQEIPRTSSIVDYIFKYVQKKFLPELTPVDPEEIEVVEEPAAMPAAKSNGNGHATWKTETDAPTCPDCGGMTVRSNSCHKCLNCGGSSSCS